MKMIVEIPKGSSDKYEYNPITKKLELDRILSVAMYYPEKYGFVPETLALDGDELDVVCLTEKTSSSKDYAKIQYAEVRVIGILKMIDDGEQDDKLLAVDNNEPELDYIQKLEDVPEERKKKIIHFFSHYKDLENKKVEVMGFKGKKEAEEILKKCQKLYKENNKNK
ncbi:inorganic diphosphatase [endosymbiont GvMRE of Glomus versiforme]|uniref:inorganic diphosphatase n=1 Tax=endosymbiont GvMRE of Glomus versiforme TaxID=2039283 RepID=UPI000EC0755A|nr:inorganic diphosphatase [endosymbiont GvMRE of Glomus versiforme]RHZ36402.1 Inorganic pyrophosphatase [endosymbiont GvMRE of Glomus versiforme]